MNTPIHSNLSTDQTAKLLGIAKSTLSKMRLTGEGPTYIKMGRRVAYRPEDIQDWLTARRRLSTSDQGVANGQT